MRKNLFLEMDLTLEPRFTKEFVIKKKDDITLDIALKNENLPVIVDGQVPRLFVRKQDGSVIVQGGTEELGDGSIVVGGNVVRIHLKNSATNTTGLCYAELELEDESGVMATHSFIFEVVDRLTDIDEAIKAVDDIYILAELERFIIQAKKDIEEIRASLDDFIADMESAVENYNISIEEMKLKIEAFTKELEDAKKEAMDSITTDKEVIIKEIRSEKDEAMTALNEKEAEALSEIESKTNLGLDEITVMTNTSIGSIDSNKTVAIDEIAVKKDEAITAITEREESALGSVDRQKDESLQEMENAKDLHTAELNSTANSKIEEIENLTVEITEELNKTIDRATQLDAQLDATTNDALNVNTELNAVADEAQSIKLEIDALLARCEELKTSLEAENAEADENVEELNTLHPESDIRIEELTRLIEQAKHYEQVVRAWIADREPAQDLTEVNRQLEVLYQAVEMLETKFSEYYTKEETDSKIEELLKDGGLRVVGAIGSGFKTAKDYMPESMKGIAVPDEILEPYGEIKHTMTIKYYDTSIGTRYVKYLFLCDLNNTDDDKYIYMNTGKTSFVLNKLKNGVDYLQIVTNSETEKPNELGQLNTSSVSIASSTNLLYDFDFNIYDTNKELVIEAPGANGISNLNDCKNDGYYTINTSFEEFSSLQNAPALNVKTDEIKGYLKSVGDIQTINLNNGEVFTRVKGGVWNSSTANSVKEGLKGIVGNSSTITAPALFKSTPGDVHYFLNTDYKQEIMLRMNEKEYAIIRCSYKATLQGYLNSSITSLYLTGCDDGNYYQSCIYNTDTGVWTCKEKLSLDSANNTRISLDANYFEIYKTDFAIYTSSSYDVKYQDIIELSFDGLKVFDDFNNALETGTYEVNVEDAISNSPAKTIKGILSVIATDNEVYQELKANETVYSRVLNGSSWSEWTKTSNEYVGTIGLSLRASVDKLNIFNDVPEPVKMPSREYVGKFLYSYLNSSKPYYVCTYIYRDKDTKATPFISATISSNTSGNYANIAGYDFDSTNSVTYRKYATDSEWSKHYGITSFNDYYSSHIYHNDVVIYSGGRNKTGIYREAMSDSVISSCDLARKAGKYYVNIGKNEYEQIQNMPPVKIEKDLETTLYVNIEGEKILQEITIEGITYTRRLGESWTGINSTFVKNDVIANIEGVEVNATDYEIETANIEDIYASCPVPNNHKKPTGTIDFKDSSGRYYRWFVYGDNAGFYCSVSGSYKYIGCYAYNIYMTERYTYSSNGVWTENTTTTTSGWYQSIGSTGEILYCDLDVCGGTSSTSYDKTNIIRKADVKTDIKVINDFNEATEYGNYVVEITEGTIAINAPVEGALNGSLSVVKTNNQIKQELTTNKNVCYSRVYDGQVWSDWKAEADSDIVNNLNNTFGNLPANVKTINYTNADGMPEIYNYLNLNGLKMMWIEVKMSEEEYNSGSGGAMYKTLNLPQEAQIYNNIFMANITSYCREGETSTLNRVVQNVEVLDNTTIRARWRHTDNTYPRIDNFKILCWGF